MLDPIYDIKRVIVANALEIASSGDVNAQGRFVLIEVFAAVTNGRNEHLRVVDVYGVSLGEVARIPRKA